MGGRGSWQGVPSYAMSGTDIAHGAIGLRASYAMSGTDMTAIDLRACNLMPGTDHAMSGTDMLHAPLSAYGRAT
eukprot:2725688-Rhodomonas_salina.1